MGNLRQNPLMVPQDGTIVMSEANSGLPLKGDFERMAGGDIKPTPFREGNWWWIRVGRTNFGTENQNAALKRVKVAPATTMPGNAEDRNRDVAAHESGSGERWVCNSVQVYVESIYRPTGASLVGISTRKNYKAFLRKSSTPLFGDMALRDLNTITLQKYFSGLRAATRLP